jgi:putative tryptophan/tyrosine transport system substrate-binding protein
MRRREFITLLSGGAAAWPLVARAQQGERVRRIGALTGIGDDELAQARFAVFVQALSQLGWIDGRNVRIDYRWGGGDIDKIRNTRRNWPPTRRTSFSPLAVQPWSSC